MVILYFAGNYSSYSIVDSNLNTLRQRIEVLRKKDKLINTIYRHENGWNYTWEYDDKHKKHSLVLELVELVGLACTNIGFVFLSGYSCLFLVSLILHIGRYWSVLFRLLKSTNNKCVLVFWRNKYLEGFESLA